MGFLTYRLGMTVFKTFLYSLNFHLPESTLLLLVCACAEWKHKGGKDFILSAYQEAIRKKYRFYSFGDAMMIL